MSGHQFSKVQVARPPRSNFDLSHDHKFSTDMGILLPTLVQECIPGDTITLRSESLIRFAPLVAPVMHKINVFMHYFFVPNRILWDNWEKFITANNGSTTVPGWPYFDFPGGSPYTLHNTLADYLGLPTRPTSESRQMIVSALPHAAYQCIYNEYYRDQNIIPEVNYKLVDGANQTNTNLFPLRRRAWQHDYFTAALPWAQKGSAVTLPLGISAEVVVNRLSPAGQTNFWSSDNGAPLGNSSFAPNRNVGGTTLDGKVMADLTNATAATINDLRRAFRLQEWLEKMARGGSRYIEQILVHFGVTSSDSRLQRPEFIGGTRNPVIISEVLQTSESADTPQATMAGHGIAGNTGKSFRYTAEEHGYIIGIQSVMPTTAYQQGVPRHFLRRSYLDYAWPTFAHIGEQPIMNQEIYHTGNQAQNEAPFGYIPRYSEYRYTPSRVSGEFRNTLAFWHLGRRFSNLPGLNQGFIECEPRNDIFAVTTGQKLWCHVYHSVHARRALPRYGTPTL